MLRLSGLTESSTGHSLPTLPHQHSLRYLQGPLCLLSPINTARDTAMISVQPRGHLLGMSLPFLPIFFFLPAVLSDYTEWLAICVFQVLQCPH